MKILGTLSSDLRINALLGCSAAVLLTACGGGASDAPDGNGQQSQFAAYSQASEESAVNVEARVVDGAVTEESMAAMPEATATGSREEQISGLYWWILGRAPDQAGLQAWVRSSLSMEAIAFQLNNSKELRDHHGWNTIGQGTQNKLYVDASTTTTNGDGSESRPFKTLPAAAKAVKASTTVFVKPGVYQGGFVTKTSGTAAGAGGKDGRIYWISTVRWGAKIVPSLTGTYDHTAWYNKGKYVHIVGFEVDGALSRNRDPKNGPVYDNWRQGIYTDADQSVIQENYVHDIGRWYPCNGGGGAGINIDAYFNGPGAADAINNWVRDTGAPACNRIQGIYMSSPGNLKNNVVYRANGGAGIHLFHDAFDATVINNTVAGSTSGIIVAAGGARRKTDKNGVPKTENVHVYNNIVVDNVYGIGEGEYQGGKVGKNYYKNNLVNGNKYAWWKMSNSNYNTVTDKPSFMEYSASKLVPNFHLEHQSAAVGRGTSENAPTTDFDGRTQGGAHGNSIGSYAHD